MVDAGHSRGSGSANVGAANVSALDADLLNAALRLVRLAEVPNFWFGEITGIAAQFHRPLRRAVSKPKEVMRRMR